MNLFLLNNYYFYSYFCFVAPVSNLTVTGNYWLEHGGLLNLSVKCQGSAVFSYCTTFHKGIYNITGNETCQVMNKNSVCNFYIQRYLKEPSQYTVVLIISNDVGTVVSPVTITVYKGDLHIMFLIASCM